MGTFTFQDIYEEEGRKILELDILHDNHCNFDCIFCPIGGTMINTARLSALKKKNYIKLEKC